MKFENYLNLKKALYIAIPCLALSFAMASCSNEESSSAETSTGTGLTLTASIPVANQGFSTRIGIDEDLISDAVGVEPYTWIENETLTLYWKNLHNDTHDRVVEFKVTNVNGQNCSMDPVTTTSLENGFYKIYSLSPHTAYNFEDGDLKTTIDLSNQNQPSNHQNHSYLGDKMYQYATTVVQVEGGNIVSGTTHLPFEFITSLFRVRVVNNSGQDITVKKIALKFSGGNQQLYSKGIFTAADPSGDHSYAVAQGAAYNDLSITTNKTLAMSAVNEYVDAYMSFFPMEGFPAGSSEVVTMSVTFETTLGTTTRDWNIPVTNAAFATGSTFFTFTGGDNSFITLTIPGAPAVPSAESVTINPSGDQELAVDETLELSATINPAGAVGAIEWSSSDDAVASVDENGVVTGVSSGDAVITATVDGTEIKSTLLVRVGVAGVGIETINAITYQTYTYTPPAGNAITWLMTNFDNTSTYNGYLSVAVTCSNDWNAPNLSDINNLFDHFDINPSIFELFLAAQTGPALYLKSYTSTNFAPVYNNTLYITTSNSSEAYADNIRRYYVNMGFYNATARRTDNMEYGMISWQGSGSSQYSRYPVRCVKRY
jgi:Bacterial surface proteins containing Ig-like domains